jgi:hypothetical protein
MRMRRCDWAGTVLLACLIALGGLLPNHGVLVGLLLAVVTASSFLLLWDVVRGGDSEQKGNTKEGDTEAGGSIRARADIQGLDQPEVGVSIEAGRDTRVGAPVKRHVPRERRSPSLGTNGRLVVIGTLVVAVATVFTYRVLFADGKAKLTTGHAVHPHLTLTGSLLAYDGAAERRWSTAIEADVTDPLRFHLTLRNNSPQPTGLLDVEPLYLEPTDQAAGLSWTVWVAVGPPEEETPLPGVSAELTPQEGSLGFLNFDPATFKVQRPGQVGWAPLYAAPSAPSKFESPYGNVRAGTAAVLGSLAPHEKQLVSFTASSRNSLGIAQSDPFEGGDIMRYRSSATSRFQQIGAASPGENLLFRILIDTPDGSPLSPVIRVAINPRIVQHSVTLTAFASVRNGAPQKLGTALVNAVDTPMISLSVVPGSARLRGYPPDTCAHFRDLGPLPDGIAEGGIEIGSVGGFRPRDPCKGDEFTREVQFAVHVANDQ